jgi:hypothetical protein
VSRRTVNPTVSLIIRRQLASQRAFHTVFAPRRASDVEVRLVSSEALSELRGARILDPPGERTCNT